MCIKSTLQTANFKICSSMKCMYNFDAMTSFNPVRNENIYIITAAVASC